MKDPQLANTCEKASLGFRLPQRMQIQPWCNNTMNAYLDSIHVLHSITQELTSSVISIQVDAYFNYYDI